MSCENEVRENDREMEEDAERKRLGLQPPLGELVGKYLNVYFRYYRDGALWYCAGLPRHQFLFPVPVNDQETGSGTFKESDKSIYFMRWIRKHKDALEQEERERRAMLPQG
jgi:hypothetical protein